MVCSIVCLFLYLFTINIDIKDYISLIKTSKFNNYSMNCIMYYREEKEKEPMSHKLLPAHKY